MTHLLPPCRAQGGSVPVWDMAAAPRAQLVRRVCERLERTHGIPRLGNPRDPVDDLVYIILSNRTTAEVAKRTYSAAKATFPTWEDLLAAPISALKRVIAPAGLSGVKSHQVRSALRRIRKDAGSCDLSWLHGHSTDEVHRYLTSLPGVSDKVAKCVMMYTLGRSVLPVDAHVHRVTTRLGWTNRKRADQCHAELEALVPAHRRYAFHVDCVVHGRAVCLPRSPRCQACPIRVYCCYGNNHVW